MGSAIVVASLAVVLLFLPLRLTHPANAVSQSTPPPPLDITSGLSAQASTTTWTTYIDAEQDNGDDEYGYEHRDFGSIDDDDFSLGSNTFEIDYIKWEDRSDDVQFRLYECLKPSELRSLQLGSRTFTNPSYTKYSDGECGSVRTRNQIFNFDSSSNPLRAGSRVKVTLTLNGSGGGANPTPTITPTPTATSTQSPTGSASLSPDPSTVSFQPDGRWHRFTVNSGGTVRVYTNPGTTPLNVEVFTSNTGNHCSNGAEREYKSRSNGQSVYLAGCNSGTGTVQLQTSSGTVIRTYTFTIGSGGGANPTPTHTATPTHTPTATHTPTTATSGCVPQALGAAADVVLKGYWSGASNRCGTSLAVACVPYSLFIVYPHFNRQQTFWFEHEPAIGSTRVEWTNDFSVTRRNPRQFLYMPILMAHEFGHAAGLWHSPGSSDAMFHAARTPRQNISGNDKNAMKAIYNHHAAH